jgi:phage tail sheath gpL-like
MAISFAQVPTNIRVPFVAVEFDSSQASQGPALMTYRGLLIGQKLTVGTAPADSIARVTSVDQVVTLAGRGSMLHRMAIAWFAANTQTETWIGVVADAAGGVAPTGTLAFTGTATASGTVSLYLGGENITVGVNAGDTSSVIATAVKDAVTANPDLPVTASAVTGTVTLTYRHKGLVGNSYDVRHSYRDGESLPAGVTVVITAVGTATPGTVNPPLSNLIATLGDSWFNIWAHPYTDATSLTAIENELNRRFGPMTMIDGLAVTSAAGTFSALTTLGNSRNNSHSVIVAQPGGNPLTPPPEFAAEVAGIVAIYGAADPARPFQTLTLSHAIAPAEADLWTLDERNLMLYDGISSTSLQAGAVVQLDRVITTYQTAPSGADDTAYLDATTMLTLMYFRYSFRVRMQTRYPRHKLSDDGARFGPGQAVMTPKIGKAEAIAWFRDMEFLGLAENFDAFKAALIVERNVQDPNRLDFMLPPDLINQLIVMAAKISFRL